jgi:hypothetical protein
MGKRVVLSFNEMKYKEKYPDVSQQNIINFFSYLWEKRNFIRRCVGDILI